MESLLALELQLFCAIIVLVLASRLRFMGSAGKVRSFRLMLLSEAVFFVSDGISGCISGNPATSVALGFIVNIVFFADTVIAPFLWLNYVNYQLYDRKLKHTFLLFIPAIFIIVLALISPFTGILFTIRSDRLYVRGMLYIAQPIVSAIYIISTSAWAIIFAIRTNSYVLRKRGFLLGLYSITPIVGAILDITITSVPFLAPFSTLGIITIFIGLQEQHLTKDTLTGLNNRYELFNYLENKKKTHSDFSIYIMSISIDNLKQIRDSFGRSLEDEILKRAASVIVSVCGRYNAFVSRADSDEFIAVIEAQTDNAIEMMKREIKRDMLSSNDMAAIKITANIGFVKSDLQGLTIEQNIDNVDIALAQDKATHIS